MTSRQSGASGFTLLEAVVAVLLMGIILVGLGEVTAQWLPNWNRGLARLQREQLLAIQLDRLMDDLAAAQFISVSAERGLPLFDGLDTSLTFVRTVLAPTAAIGLQVVRIAQIGVVDRSELVRIAAPLPTGTEIPFDFSDPVVLIHSPYRVSFSYAGPDLVWRDRWQDQRVLPRAIRVQIRDDMTSTPIATMTSTPVHVEIPASCTWTGISLSC